MTLRIAMPRCSCALGLILGVLLVGCSSSEDGSNETSGATGGSAGTTATTGGLASTGGSSNHAGTFATTLGGTSVSGSVATGGRSYTGGASSAGGVTANPNGWSLVWSDEFSGSTIDGTKWEHEVNCWGGGNGEQQCYVADAKNSFVTDGALHLVALNDNPSGAIGGPGNDPKVVTLPHSSARLRTKHLGDWTYGRFEANAKLPSGKGLWPAFWMLPTEEVYGGWASSGEIDIMEAVNLTPGANRVYGTIHYGAAWPGNVNTGAFYDPPTNVWDTFHTYAVEWEEGEIRWFVDDHHYATQVRWNTTASTFPAPFNQLFHLLLNVAVGGAWPGSPDAKTTFPQEMVVDWVRVYQCAADPATGHGCGTTDPAVKPL